MYITTVKANQNNFCIENNDFICVKHLIFTKMCSFVWLIV